MSFDVTWFIGHIKTHRREDSICLVAGQGSIMGRRAGNGLEIGRDCLASLLGFKDFSTGFMNASLFSSIHFCFPISKDIPPLNLNAR